MEAVILPCHLPNWPQVKRLLNKLNKLCLNERSTIDNIVNTLNDICQVTGVNNGTTTTRKSLKSNNDIWKGFGEFLNTTSEEERTKIVFSTLPSIINLAIEIEDEELHLPYSIQQHESVTVLPRKFIASLLACGFLCLYPSRRKDESSKLNHINFNLLIYHLPMPAQIAKVQCLLHYFDKITASSVILEGHVSYIRKCLEEKRIPEIEDYMSCEQELCPFIIHKDGHLEDIDSTCLEVDFANCCIGGGSLGKGAAQEEIRFMTCPELIAAQLFMETMEDNEAIIIIGYKQYSKHTGYSSSFTYAGDYDKQVNRENIMCCIDATSFRKKAKKLQYCQYYILRDINKALIGFSGSNTFSDRNNISEPLIENVLPSDEDNYDTAIEYEASSPRYISEFASQMLGGLLSQATREIVEKNQQIPKAQNVSNVELMVAAGNIPNVCIVNEPNHEQAVLSDGQIIVGSTEQLYLNTSNLLSANIYDSLEVEINDWVNNLRRRSSNLSEINSRRSSSSTKHSSDISSDLDEIYESFLKTEKTKPGTIQEESFDTISDFATRLISCLMQEGTSTAATMLPINTTSTITTTTVTTTTTTTPITTTTKDIYTHTSVIELVADKTLKSVLTIAILEAVSILGQDSSNNKQHSSSPNIIPQSTYIWFADRIVADAFLQASEEVSTRPVERDSFSSSDSVVVHLVEDRLSGYDSSISSVSSSDPKRDSKINIEDIENSLEDNKLNDTAALIVKSVMKHIQDDNILNKLSSDQRLVKFDDSALENDKNKNKESVHNHSVTFADDKQSTLTHWTSEEKMKKCDNVNMGILTKKLSRETLTNAYLKVENRRHAKSYERRSSEPCHISVERSLRALDNEQHSSHLNTKNRKISRTDDDFDRFKADSQRRGSWDIMPSSRRRSSCGFKDPVLSRFAEELMKADTSVPALEICDIYSTSTGTGSRRSSISAFKDMTLANLELELLGSSFEAPSSPNSYRRRSRDYRLVRSDSSDTEYMWFPPPRRVGYEFQENFERLQNYHSVDEIEDFASVIAQNVLQQAVDILNHEQKLNYSEDHIQEIEVYAEKVSMCVLDEAFNIMKREKELLDNKCDQLISKRNMMDKYACDMATNILHNVIKQLYRKIHKLDYFKVTNSTCISTGNWGCGAFCGDPHLKCLLQWMASSIAGTPVIHYFIFEDNRLNQLEEVIKFIQDKNWNVGDVMKVIIQYCDLLLSDCDFLDDESTLPLTLFDFVLTY